MAIKDGDGPSTGASPLEEGSNDREVFEVLDEEEDLKLHARGPRRDRWPANDYY